MIWGKCLRSPLPNAQIRRIDVQKAKKIKGVFAVVTATDIPARLTGIILKDMPILAQDRVRFLGERVAVIGAQPPDVAEEAINRIEVDYEEQTLPSVASSGRGGTCESSSVAAFPSARQASDRAGLRSRRRLVSWRTWERSHRS
jgi:CO/xanthine dehydrogenase Mo-binding subunit